MIIFRICFYIIFFANFQIYEFRRNYRPEYRFINYPTFKFDPSLNKLVTRTATYKWKRNL